MFPRCPIPVRRASVVPVLTLILCGVALFAGGCRKKEAGRPEGRSPADWAADLEKLTKKAPVRLVWLDGGKVRAFDSSAPSQPATIRDAAGVQRPLIGPDGATTVFSEAGKIQAVTWPAGAPRTLGDGVAVDLWRDPAAKADWVYAAPTEAGEALKRFRLSDPAQSEPVWEKGRFDPPSLQLSRDGKRFGAVFFGRHAAVADIAPKEWVPLANVPLMAFASDDSGMTVVVDSTGRRLRFLHTEATMYEAPHDGGPTHIESVEALPAFRDRRITALRWTNHPRYLVAATLPAAGKGAGEVALVRLSPSLDHVEDAAAIASGGDPAQPDAWVGGGESAATAENIEQHGRLKGQVDDPRDAEMIRWPSTFDGLHFLWEDDWAINLLPGRKEPCEVQPTGFARFGQWGAMDLDGGTFTADPLSVKEFVKATAQSNVFTVELLLTESVLANGSISGRICALQLDDQHDAFSLSRVDDGLVLRVLLQEKDKPAREYQTVLGPMKVVQNVPLGISFECSEGMIDWRVSGAGITQPYQLGGSSTAAWGTATDPKWVFGDAEPQGVTGWRMTIQRVLAYSRGVPTENRSLNAASTGNALSDRLTAAPVRLQARLTAVAPAPSADKTAPAGGKEAPDQLAQCVYDVVSVHSGRFEDKKIAVFHHRTINGESCPELPTDVGETYELMIVPLDERREVEALPMALTDSGFSLPQYFSVMSPKRPLAVVKPAGPRPPSTAAPVPPAPAAKPAASAGESGKGKSESR